MRTLNTLFSSLWRGLKGLGTKQKWIAAVIGTALVFGVGYAAFGPRVESTDISLTDSPRSVTLIPVSSIAENAERTEGGAETVIRAEAAGKIVSVLPVGTRVSSGATIAQFENAAQRAALLQAEGALEAAEAALEKTQGGLRSEKIAVLEAAVASSESGAVATLLTAYGTVDSAVRDTADEMLSNADTAAPQLNFASSNNQRRNEIENMRVLLGDILQREATVASTISADADIDSELTTTEGELRTVRTFIDTLIAALNEAIPTGNVSSADIAAYKAAATAARTSLTTSLSAIASTRGSLETARQNLDEGLAGAEDADIAAAAAAVKQSQGAYNAALAAYQKTIVRAPSAGTVLSCNASVGDVLTVGTDVCRVQTAPASAGDTFVLPLASVKYTPGGALVFVVTEDSTLQGIFVETSLVTAHGITVTGLFGDEFVVADVRGLKSGQKVTLE